MLVDDGAAAIISVAVVFVVEWHGYRPQLLVRGHVSPHHIYDGTDGVGEKGCATFRAGLQAVQELKSRRLKHVEEVHVEAEVLVSVGNIFGGRLVADIPGVAVKGVFEGAYASCDCFDGRFGFGNVFEKDEAVGVEVIKDFFKSGVVGHVGFVRVGVVRLVKVGGVPGSS